MDIPKGLRRPHHLAELLPVLLAFAMVTTATLMAFIHIARTPG
jgi:hypothetical protein